MKELKIDEKRCAGYVWGSSQCSYCVPYCPVGAITIKKTSPFDKGIIDIDQEKCVECGVCLRFYCPRGVVNLFSTMSIPGHGAIIQPELAWPRALRVSFSDALGYHGKTDLPGRGTEEMKTNDVTQKFKFGEVGICVELGRPGIGTSFEDVEKVTVALAEHGVEFESRNPITSLIDTKSGRIKDPAVRKERVLSGIIEVKTHQENLLRVLETVRQISKRIDTVMSFEVMTLCEGTEIPGLTLLEKAGFQPRINGKVCIGLGRRNEHDSHST